MPKQTLFHTGGILNMSIAKRFVKRTGALVLAMMLAVGMILTASAKNFADVGRDHDYAEQIGILSDMGVIIGTGVDEDGNALFSPEMKVNREQMALLLFRFMLNRSSAGTVNSSPFTDLVGEIYNGAISWASAAGYIIGTGPNTFNPNQGRYHAPRRHDNGRSRARIRQRSHGQGLSLDLHQHRYQTRS
ncbi:MAG: S-layer homology domain-containing protein [Clostridiales bacterium]|nr:S-layer homology domain-containing protein [Clostridiales bacterium]